LPPQPAQMNIAVASAAIFTSRIREGSCGMFPHAAAGWERRTARPRSLRQGSLD
jgi:hypothetical protein